MGEYETIMKKIRQFFTILLTVSMILSLCCGAAMAEEVDPQTSSSSVVSGQSEDPGSGSQDAGSSDIELDEEERSSGSGLSVGNNDQDVEEDVPGKNTGMSTANRPEQEGVTEGLEISLSVTGLQNEAEAMARDFRFVIEKYVEEEAAQAVTPEQKAVYAQQYTVAELYVKDSDRFNTMTWDEETKTAVYTMKADQLQQLDYGRYLVKLDTTSEKIEEKSSEEEFTGYYEVTGESGANEFREDVGFLIVIGPDEQGTGKVIRMADQEDSGIGDCVEDEASRIMCAGITAMFTTDSLVGSPLAESLQTLQMAAPLNTEPTRVSVLLNYAEPKQTSKTSNGKKNQVTAESIADELTGAAEGKGNVIIFNYSDFTEETLAGTELALTGTKSESWTTIDGKAHAIPNLPEGSYTVTPKRVPDGYTAGDAVTFTVDAEGIVQVNGSTVKTVTAEGKQYYKIEVFQKAQTVPIDIYKVNSNGETVGGADLSIILPSGKELRNWQTTIGKLRRIDLAAGEYTLHENSAPEGLKIADDIKFSVDGSGKLFVNGEQTDKVNMVDEGTARGTNPDGSSGDNSAPTSAPTSTNTKAAQVKTGDENKTAVWVVMIGVLSCLLGTFVLLKKKQEREAAKEAAEEQKEQAEAASISEDSEDAPQEAENPEEGNLENTESGEEEDPGTESDADADTNTVTEEAPKGTEAAGAEETKEEEKESETK